jgi:predicted DNA-binding protein (MmcQ/YjbR family)
MSDGPALTWETLRAYCLTKPGAWPDEPWEGDVVAKVGSKIFAFLGAPSDPGGPTSVGVKCGRTREEADEWLARYPDDARVMAYIGRSGWNTLTVGGAIPDEEVREAVDASYDAVVARLPKRSRLGLTVTAARAPGTVGPGGHSPVMPSSSSRVASACPACRAVSLTRCSSTHRRSAPSCRAQGVSSGRRRTTSSVAAARAR